MSSIYTYVPNCNKIEKSGLWLAFTLSKKKKNYASFTLVKQTCLCIINTQNRKSLEYFTYDSLLFNLCFLFLMTSLQMDYFKYTLLSLSKSSCHLVNTEQGIIQGNNIVYGDVFH